MGKSSKYKARRQKRGIGEEIMSSLWDVLNLRHVGDIPKCQNQHQFIFLTPPKRRIDGKTFLHFLNRQIDKLSRCFILTITEWFTGLVRIWTQNHNNSSDFSWTDLKMSLLYLMKTQMKVKKTHHQTMTVTLISVAGDWGDILPGQWGKAGVCGERPQRKSTLTMMKRRNLRRTVETLVKITYTRITPTQFLELL